MNTRIAPSPTGDFHIGTARTAYFNWLAARSTGGKFMLRIDDTDLKRSKKEFETVILDSLAWLGLDYDSLVRQSDRFDRYREVAASLPTKKSDDTGAILFDFDAVKDGILGAWYDEIAGTVAVKTGDEFAEIRDMVLIKADGSPTYNFCTVVDDIDFGIDTIIRGVDHISNTSRQATLFKVIGRIASIPKFYHVGLICKKNAPLSKRDGAAGLLKYKEIGFDPDAMLNFLARMGWGPTKDDKTTATLSRDRMLELFFAGGRMKNTPANLDLDKLESFDRKYKAQKKIWRTSEKLTAQLA